MFETHTRCVEGKNERKRKERNKTTTNERTKERTNERKKRNNERKNERANERRETRRRKGTWQPCWSSPVSGEGTSWGVLGDIWRCLRGYVGVLFGGMWGLCWKYVGGMLGGYDVLLVWFVYLICTLKFEYPLISYSLTFVFFGHNSSPRSPCYMKLSGNRSYTPSGSF